MTEKKKPLFYMDIDGVLNPFTSKKIEGYSWFELNAGKVLANKSHIDWIDANRDNFDFVWATSWELQANKHFAPAVGLEPFSETLLFGNEYPHLDFKEIYPNDSIKFGLVLNGYFGHKIKWVAAHAKDRPFIFCDDLLTEREEQWAKERTQDGIPTLFHSPLRYDGLVDRDLKIFESFLDQL